MSKVLRQFWADWRLLGLNIPNTGGFPSRGPKCNEHKQKNVWCFHGPYISARFASDHEPALEISQQAHANCEHLRFLFQRSAEVKSSHKLQHENVYTG